MKEAGIDLEELAGRQSAGGYLQRDEEAVVGIVDSYELMCTALYFGVERSEEARGGGKRQANEGGFWFGDAGLLDVKSKADQALQALSRAVRAWAATRTRS